MVAARDAVARLMERATANKARRRCMQASGFGEEESLHDWLANAHFAAFAAPDHGADPPPSVLTKQLDAVDAAVEQRAVAGFAGLVGAQHVRDVAEQARLAPDLPFPEAGHLAGRDHPVEIDAIRLHVELEDSTVVDAHHARAGGEDFLLPVPVGLLTGLE